MTLQLSTNKLWIKMKNTFNPQQICKLFPENLIIMYYVTFLTGDRNHKPFTLSDFAKQESTMAD